MFDHNMLLQVAFRFRRIRTQRTFEWPLANVSISYVLRQCRLRCTRHVTQCTFVAIHMAILVRAQQLFGCIILETLRTLIWFCKTNNCVTVSQCAAQKKSPQSYCSPIVVGNACKTCCTIWRPNHNSDTQTVFPANDFAHDPRTAPANRTFSCTQPNRISFGAHS